jgi:hypothetical protein
MTREIAIVIASPGSYTSWGTCLENSIAELGTNNMVITFGSGTYTTLTPSDKLDLIGLTNIIVRGSGSLSSIISTATSINANAIWISNGTNILIKNLKFVGKQNVNLNGDDIVHQGIKIDSDNTHVSEEIKISACYFQGYKTGAIRIEPSVVNVKIEGSVFYKVDNKLLNVGDYGAVHAYKGDNIVIVGNTFDQLRYSGISLLASVNAVIDGNSIVFDSAAGEEAMGINSEWGIRNAKIVNNSIYGSRSEGVIFSNRRPAGSASAFDSRNNYVAYNEIHSYGYGIVFNHDAERFEPQDPHERNTIIHNNSYGLGESPAYGIYGRHLKNSLIGENFIQGAQQGIYLRETSTGNLVEGNTIAGTVDNGVLAMAGGAVQENSFINCKTGIQMGGAYRSMITGNTFTNVARQFSIDPVYGYLYYIIDN